MFNLALVLLKTGGRIALGALPCVLFNFANPWSELRGLWMIVDPKFLLLLIGVVSREEKGVNLGRRERECRECVASREALKKRGGQEALDAVAMATFAQLSYAEWEQTELRDAPAWFEVHGRSNRTSLWLQESGRWSRCVFERTSQGTAGTRWPRPGPSSAPFRRCDGPLKRRWDFAYWLWDWHEASGGPTKWHSTNVLIGVRSDGALAIAFRGSADPRNAATNLQPLTRPDDLSVPGRTLHGIRRAFANVDTGNVTALHRLSHLVLTDPPLAAIFQPLHDNGRPLADILEQVATTALDQNRPVFLGGHSLGAALAVQLAARLVPSTPTERKVLVGKRYSFAKQRPPRRLKQRRRPRLVRLVTFGEPAFGDAAFYAAHAHLAPLARRFLSISAPPLCAADVVAGIATFVGAGKHATPPTYVCDPRRPPGPITAHHMAAYVRGVRAATRLWLDLHVAIASALMPHLMPNGRSSVVHV